MASRKPAIPLGSGLKSNLHTEISKDESSAQPVTKGISEGNTDYERRKARVALRSGSPKPPTRVSLRSIRAKTPQASLPITSAPSRLSGSPSRLATSSKGSLRLKPSPERRPWGAPTIRVPPCHEESVSRRKRISTIATEVYVQENVPYRQKPRVPRYTIDDLLALRPPPTARYAALSYSQLETNMVLTNYHSAPLPVLYTVPVVQPHFNKLPTSYWEQQTAFYGGETSNYSVDNNVSSIVQRQGSHNDTIQTLPFKNGASQLEEISQTLAFESPVHRGRLQAHQTELSPTQQSRGQSEDNSAAIVEDLECRIRSALSHRGRRQSSSLGTPIARTVRWDPAVITPIDQDTSDGLNQAGKAKAAIMDEKPFPEQAAPEKDAKQMEVFVEQKHLESPSAARHQSEESCSTAGSETQTSHDEPQSAGRKKHKKEFYQYMKSITELKKGDRKKLLQLLEALKNLDSDDSSESDTESQSKCRKTKKADRTEPKSDLNPTAVAFPAHSALANVAGKPASKSLDQPIVPLPAAESSGLTSVKQIDTKTDGKEGGYNKLNQENKPYQQAEVCQVTPSHKNITSRKSRSDTDVTYLQQAPYFFPSTQLHPYTLPLAPVQNRLLRNAPLPFEATKVNPKLPIIDLATGRVPGDDGPGREAHVVAWGNAILESFQQKYPMTGVQRADPPAPVRSTHAATIQQRLEYLLMEQKEKQAREGLLRPGGNLQGSKLVKQIYQAEKEAMKRLKAEIRRDEAQRKLHEPQLSATQLKMRMQVPGTERISEASTCIEHVSEVSETETEEREEEDVTIDLHHD